MNSGVKCSPLSKLMGLKEKSLSSINTNVYVYEYSECIKHYFIYLYSNSKPTALAVNITALEGGLKVAIYKIGFVMVGYVYLSEIGKHVNSFIGFINLEIYIYLNLKSCCKMPIVIGINMYFK